MPSTTPTVRSQTAYGAAWDCCWHATLPTITLNDETPPAIRDRQGKLVKVEARPNYQMAARRRMLIVGIAWGVLAVCKMRQGVNERGMESRAVAGFV